MNAQLSTILRRRAELVTKAATQRSELGYWLQPWQTPLAFMSRGMALARRIRKHPMALAMGVLLMLGVGQGRWSVWFGRFWTGWQIYQSLRDQPARPRD